MFKITNWIDGALYDEGKTKYFTKNEEVKLIVDRINTSKKQVYLTETRTKITNKNKTYNYKKSQNFKFETEAFQLKFFLEKKVGDKVKCTYKNYTEKLGHFFTIYKGFDGFLYDPKFNNNGYTQGKEYEMIIDDMNKSERKLSLKRKK